MLDDRDGGGFLAKERYRGRKTFILQRHRPAGQPTRLRFTTTCEIVNLTPQESIPQYTFGLNFPIGFFAVLILDFSIPIRFDDAIFRTK